MAIAFWFKAKAPIRAGKVPYKAIYRQMVPYSIALAPAAVLTPLFQSVCLSFLASNTVSQGLFSFAYQLSLLVTTVQAGFSTYWGPYVFAHYRDEQARIGRIHDLLNFLIFGFFCLLVMFEDIIFFIFPSKAACMRFFPLMMLPRCPDPDGRYPCTAMPSPAVPTTTPSAWRWAWAPNWCSASGWCPSSRSPARHRPGGGQRGDVPLPHRDRSVLLPHHPQLSPHRIRLFAGAGHRRGGCCILPAVCGKFVLVGAILFIYCTLYRPQLQKLWQLGLGLLRKLARR